MFRAYFPPKSCMPNNAKIKINRNKWLRGKGSDKSTLLNSSGKMCCLGFLSRAYGYKAKDIKHKNCLSNLYNEIQYKFLPENMLIQSNNFLNIFYESNLTATLMDINDNYLLTDEERIAELNKTCENLNADFKFVLED